MRSWIPAFAGMTEQEGMTECPYVSVASAPVKLAVSIQARTTSVPKPPDSMSYQSKDRYPRGFGGFGSELCGYWKLGANFTATEATQVVRGTIAVMRLGRTLRRGSGCWIFMLRELELTDDWEMDGQRRSRSIRNTGKQRKGQDSEILTQTGDYRSLSCFRTFVLS